MSSQSTVDRIVRILSETGLNECDQMLLLERVKAEICTPSMLAKVHNPGAAEILACSVIGLRWSEKVHGCDAKDSERRGVEIKTSSKTKGTNRLNFKYDIPPLRSGETTSHHKRRVYDEFIKNKKYEGGHYLVYLNKGKTVVYSYYFISKERMAKYASEYASEHPTSRSFNLGRNVCKKCKHCCWLLVYGRGYCVNEPERSDGARKIVSLAGPCS